MTTQEEMESRTGRERLALDRSRSTSFMVTRWKEYYGDRDVGELKEFSGRQMKESSFCCIYYLYVLSSGVIN